MADTPEPKIKKEWISQAMGGINLSADDKIDNVDLDKEAVILVQGTNLFGDSIYSYVKVKLRNFRELRVAMLKGENFTPSDFGEVVAAGRGEPTQEIRDEMRVTYNMVDVTRQVEAARTSSRPTGFAQPKFFDDDE